ncbi:MAG TPA: CoA transferase [Burkholderiaceae bacterium]|nr:CoA transferase [Burkholderiaceae bacterium]
MTDDRPLDGLKVIDESQGAIAGLATMVLADFGAQVTKIEPPAGDPWRAMPSAPLWLRGKRSAVLQPELAADRRALLALAGRADVWIRGPVAVAGSPSDAELQQTNPRLIIGWVSAFGRTGPYAGYPPYEALVAAKVGRMLQFRGLPSRSGPVYAALQVATHATSQSLLSGVLAALRARDRDGVGQVLETSLARGLLPYEMNNVLAPQVNALRRAQGEPELPAAPDPALVMPTLNYHPLRTRDGRWLQMGNLLPHLFMNFLRAIGLTDELDKPHIALPADQWPEATREALRDRLLMRLQDKTLDEWQTLFVADGGVASHPYQSTQQALDDPDAVANGHSIAMGKTGRQLGLLANLTRTPGRAGSDAPAIGQHTRAVLEELNARDALADTTGTRGAANPEAAAAVQMSSRGPRPAPLAGITVVEAATIIAAPFGAALLADLGARVIKLEPREGDPFRGMAPGLGAARVNTGKECIGLDLKQPQAQEIAQRLVARADVFIHNYRPGVPERLGLGYEQLAALNPGLVYVSANGYGPAGPGALRPSTHPIPGAAMGGVLHQIGGAPSTEPMDLAQLRETARRLMRANDVNPDPNTSLVICSSVLLGLQARERRGVGQAIFVDMFGANAYANFDDCLRYPDKAPRESPDREGHGLNPLWRLYRASQGWVFLAIANPNDWQRMRQCLGNAMAGVPALDYQAARQGGEPMIAALQAMFAGDTAPRWEARLAPHGVGCVQADAQLPEQFFASDPQAQIEQLLLPARHPQWGAYLRHGAQVVLHGTPGVYAGTGVAGGHTAALLSELGFDEEAQRALRAAAAVA